MNAEKTSALVDRSWDESIVTTLMDYIRIPNKSPAFDPDWEAHGHMEKAVQLMRGWAEAHSLPGMRIDVHRLPGRTPVLLIDVPGQIDDSVLLYGHLDKQPEFTGWSEGLAPWTPVLRDGRLYGRGGADDGYALFASLAAIRALEQQGIPPRALRDPDRSVRRERQLRPRAPHRGPGRPARLAQPGRMSGRGVRQLQPALVHDVAARQPCRRAARRRADRGRALGHGKRRGAVEFSGIAGAAIAHRGRQLGRAPARGAQHPDPRRAAPAGRCRCGCTRRLGLRKVSNAAWTAPDVERPVRTTAQQHVAPDACPSPGPKECLRSRTRETYCGRTLRCGFRCGCHQHSRLPSPSTR